MNSNETKTKQSKMVEFVEIIYLYFQYQIYKLCVTGLVLKNFSFNKV